MEIFTSMTFWIIVVLIVVLLAIIGFVAEGTILGSKKKENKKEEKKEEAALNAWAEDAPTTDDKQETVYNTAEQSWLDMPDVSMPSANEVNAEPLIATAPETPKTEEISTSTPATQPPVAEKSESTEVLEKATVSAPNPEELKPISETNSEKTETVSEVLEPKPENKQKEAAETLDVWKN